VGDVSQLLTAAERGDPNAAAELLVLVYEELRRLAARQLADERPGQTLQPTALVHEAYLRLAGRDQDQRWDGRAHFFAAAAEAMRRILVENVRRKARLKRGGQVKRRDLDPDLLPEGAADDERLLALDEALTRFAEIEPTKAELVKLRTFAGMTLNEAAAVLGVSPATADRWWAYAKAWLRVEISGENPPPA
jgi:RNA polymerase sigma factor (TIGR02999 family)